jgi:hydroxymethylpyrimidine pyrophosphatase-like HAD family hydrolase
MSYQALATDYDGTLATHGSVDQETIRALIRFAASGRKLIMVTGRELPDLKRVFPEFKLFVRVVAENGALLYDPANNRETLLCGAAREIFVATLRSRGVPVSVGRAIVATVEPHEEAVRQAIEETGISLQVSLNKGSIMVLPAGVNKTTGLRTALNELGISEAAVVGVGDAENDVDFLSACGCGVAVANALPSVKSRAQLVTRGAHGAGVVEVIEQLLANDRLPCGGGVREFLVSE